MRRRLCVMRGALLLALPVGLLGTQTNLSHAQSLVRTRAPDPCLITGVVKDAQSQPVGGARLRVLGTSDSTRTDVDGSYVLRSCGADRRIETRRLGFEPDTSVLTQDDRALANHAHSTAANASFALSDSAAGRSRMVHDIVLRAVAITLATTRVEARLGGIGILSSGFFERRERGFGVFLGPEQLSRRVATDVTQLLRGLPGVTVDSRPGTQMRLTVRRCVNPTIWMDGVRLRGGYALEIVDPRTIEGIEVYRGFSEMPVQFHDPSGCGAVVFWSKTAAPN